MQTPEAKGQRVNDRGRPLHHDKDGLLPNGAHRDLFYGNRGGVRLRVGGGGANGGGVASVIVV